MGINKKMVTTYSGLTLDGVLNIIKEHAAADKRSRLLSFEVKIMKSYTMPDGTWVSNKYSITVTEDAELTYLKEGRYED